MVHLHEVGQMVKKLREIKGYSIVDLSKATGFTHTEIDKIENGIIDIDKKKALILAKAFNVHPASILFSDY